MVVALRASNSKVKIIITQALTTKGAEAATMQLNQKISQYVLSHSTSEQPMALAAVPEGFDVFVDLTNDGTLTSSTCAQKMAATIASSIQPFLGPAAGRAGESKP